MSPALSEACNRGQASQDLAGTTCLLNYRPRILPKLFGVCFTDTPRSNRRLNGSRDGELQGES
jgi:hypothetical protein